LTSKGPGSKIAVGHVKRSVTVEVAGQKLTLRTEAGEDYLHELARFVNDKIAEVKTSTRTFSTHALAILAALNIADELFQAQKGQAELRRRVREKAQRIGELLDKVPTSSDGKQ
jgi:cell division protein ZapA